MCTVLPPPGANPITVNKYINIYIYIYYFQYVTLYDRLRSIVRWVNMLIWPKHSGVEI